MESMKQNSKGQNPVELLKNQNDAIQKEVTKVMNAKNAKMEKNIGRKNWELERKRAYLKEHNIIPPV